HPRPRPARTRDSCRRRNRKAGGHGARRNTRASPALRFHRPRALDGRRAAMTDTEHGFTFLRKNHRPPKPRDRGVTEIRGPYYTPMGPRYLEDVLETMGEWIDTLKFAGGSFSLMPKRAVRALIDLCHRHEVTVSTGGFVEYVLLHGADAVDRYLGECKDL